MKEIDLTSKIPPLEFKLGADYFVFSSDQINRKMLKDLIKDNMKMVFIYLTSDHTEQILRPTGLSKVIIKVLQKVDWYLAKVHKSEIQCETKFVYRRLGVFSSNYITLYSYNPNISLECLTTTIDSVMMNDDTWFVPAGFKRGKYNCNYNDFSREN